ncbi:hypothetical protein ACFEW4_004163, partial [Shigella dysenteriae]
YDNMCTLVRVLDDEWDRKIHCLNDIQFFPTSIAGIRPQMLSRQPGIFRILSRRLDHALKQHDGNPLRYNWCHGTLSLIPPDPSNVQQQTGTVCTLSRLFFYSSFPLELFF